MKLQDRFYVGQKVMCGSEIDENDIKKAFKNKQTGVVVSVTPRFVTVLHEKGWRESFDSFSVQCGLVKEMA